VKHTPSTRALIGCLALDDGASLNKALKLAGYRIDLASPVLFKRGRCYQPPTEGWRVVTRDGRIVRVSGSAWGLSMWMFKLGRKLRRVVGERPIAAKRLQARRERERVAS